MSQQTQQSTRTVTQIKYPDRFNVVLLNDDFTPMEFVIQLLIEVFNANIEEAKEVTVRVHDDGKGIAGSYGLEIAEQKQQEATIISRHHGHPLKVIIEKVE
jgi:ATP-dependent Clp protease adaptor protein ClpS|tara:strand:+ start:719 stop:1021 length:303 start_codon:yes stop_codon:yes gene_type:complete